MCGITGLYAFNELGKFHMINLSAATEALSHRGPDFGRTDIIDRVGLGHRRLSIIDTSADGHQPMRDPSGRYIIIFNGEIYNYAALRQRLQQRGVAFQSATDTEVLLQLYIHEGRACLRSTQRLLCLRDLRPATRPAVRRPRPGGDQAVALLSRRRQS